MAVDLDLIIEPDVTFAMREAALVHVVDYTLSTVGVKRPCMLSVSVVSEERMRELNARWRGVNTTTDVLSLECERPDDPDLADGEPCELGDIVLAPAYIRAQAARVGTSEHFEFTLMLVHGLLHLLGYDHIKEEDAAIMESLEDAIVAELVGENAGHVVTTRHQRKEGASL